MKALKTNNSMNLAHIEENCNGGGEFKCVNVLPPCKDDQKKILSLRVQFIHSLIDNITARLQRVNIIDIFVLCKESWSKYEGELIFYADEQIVRVCQFLKISFLRC